MSADQQQLQRNEDVRRTVMGYLAQRSTVAQTPQTIAQRLRVQHDFSTEEVKAACLFLLSDEMISEESDEAVTTAMLDVVFDDLARAGKRVKALVIDATNETFFAQCLAKRFRSRCAVYLIKGSENLTYAGETMTAKQLLGNLFANEHTDGRIASPVAPWVKDDRR